ncbi:MAG: hypothetical protein LBR76_08745 [Oscillospiraceae bacterium]|nr:hypothetical protein [Oscillospiraceae bacterium]
MKRIVFGIGMFIGSVIGFTGTVSTAIANGLLNGNLLKALKSAGLLAPFIVFTVLAILGMFVAISGLTEREITQSAVYRQTEV